MGLDGSELFIIYIKDALCVLGGVLAVMIYILTVDPFCKGPLFFVLFGQPPVKITKVMKESGPNDLPGHLFRIAFVSAYDDSSLGSPDKMAVYIGGMMMNTGLQIKKFRMLKDIPAHLI